MRQYSSTVDEAALDRDAVLLVAEVGRDRAAADGDQQQLGLEGLAALEGDRHAGVGVLDALEPDAELEVDAAPAERALEQLGVGLVLERHAGAAAPRRW